MDEWRSFIRKIMESAIRRNEVRGDTNIEQLITFVISTLEGSVMLGSLYDDPEIVDRTAEELMRYLRTRAAVLPDADS